MKKQAKQQYTPKKKMAPDVAKYTQKANQRYIRDMGLMYHKPPTTPYVIESAEKNTLFII